VIRLLKSGDEPTHVPDEVIAAIRRRERNGAIDLPKKRGLKTGDRVRVVSGLFAGRSGLCAGVSREHIAVLLYILGAQRQVRLRDDAVEPA
jgi:transcription antitermination factor NusG